MQTSSKTDWARVKREAEADAPVALDTDAELYDPNDAAAVDAFWDAAIVRRPGQRGKQKTPIKVPTTIRFDADVLAALKSTGKGWQTRVNDAMREWLKTHQ
ncbi:MAG: BrnA antitoxin family protein [Methylococcaceae bacterium]|nr:BrnA antitoxin family protein [Methylococcaceae bacterium]